MPGYDRTGPRGLGPRTGWGLGRCGRPADRARALEEAAQEADAFGYGWRRGGGRGFGGGGRARRRGLGFGWGARGAPRIADAEVEREQGFLRRRIEELTEELDRMRQLLSKESPEGTAD